MMENTKNPFIAGNWVRGKNYFGHQNLINEILEGNRNYLWVAGTRRLGKTSLLKQIELLTIEGEYATKFISLFWDMQGSQDIHGLKEALLESIEVAEERFDDIGVNIGELESLDVFGILRTLRRKAKEGNLNLMLLCDEAEELINIEKNNPEALPKLRRFFQRGENIYTVLTATKRLSKLEESSIPHTSPFLYGFVPPTYLTRLSDEEGISFISMEYIDGQNLKTWRQNQALNLHDKFKIAIQAGKGLAQAHKRDIVHRDVKSDNIMVTKEGEVKIMDFGLAKTLKQAEKEITRTGTTLGTLAYMSPEQASGLATDHRTDIFSYGIVLYELFTGELPFPGEFELSVLYAIMNESPKPLREINPELPEGLEKIVEKALQKDKENRYQTMDELVADLEKLMEEIH